MHCCQLGPGKDGQGTVRILDPWPGPCTGCTTRRESKDQPLSASHFQGVFLGRGEKASKPCDQSQFWDHSAGGSAYKQHFQQTGGGADSTKKSLQRVEPGHRILAALGLSTEPQHQTTCTASPWKWFLGLVLTQPQHLQNILGLLPSDTLPGFTQGKPRKGKAEPPATAESR